MQLQTASGPWVSDFPQIGKGFKSKTTIFFLIKLFEIFLFWQIQVPPSFIEYAWLCAIDDSVV